MSNIKRQIDVNTRAASATKRLDSNWRRSGPQPPPPNGFGSVSRQFELDFRSRHVPRELQLAVSRPNCGIAPDRGRIRSSRDADLSLLMRSRHSSKADAREDMLQRSQRFIPASARRNGRVPACGHVAGWTALLENSAWNLSRSRRCPDISNMAMGFDPNSAAQIEAQPPPQPRSASANTRGSFTALLRLTGHTSVCERSPHALPVCSCR